MNTTRNDGGPAFPSPAVYDPSREQVNPSSAYGADAGMTLRDYFIAHAPAEPQPWFHPVMPPAPVVPMFHEAPEEVKSELSSADYEDFIDPAHMTQATREWHDKRKTAHNAMRAHNAEREKQRYVQWPAAWADEMLKARSA